MEGGKCVSDCEWGGSKGSPSSSRRGRQNKEFEIQHQTHTHKSRTQQGHTNKPLCTHAQHPTNEEKLCQMPMTLYIHK